MCYIFGPPKLSMLPCQLEHLEVSVQCSGSSMSLHLHLLSLQPRKAFLYVATPACTPAAVSLNWESSYPPGPHQIHPQEWQSGTGAQLSEFFCILWPLLQHQLLPHRDGNNPPLITPHFRENMFFCHEKLLKKTPLRQPSPAEEQEELCPLPLLPEQQGFRTVDPLRSHQCSSPPGALESLSRNTCKILVSWSKALLTTTPYVTSSILIIQLNVMNSTGLGSTHFH